MSTGADFALACALDDTISKKAYGIMLVSPAVPPGFNDESYATNPAMDILIRPNTPRFLLRAFSIVERALLHTASQKPEILEETVGSKPDKAFARGNGTINFKISPHQHIISHSNPAFGVAPCSGLFRRRVEGCAAQLISGSVS
jgi:hypothetical protein